MTERERERRTALLDLLANDESSKLRFVRPNARWTSLPAGVKPWPRGDELKRRLAEAWLAWRRLEHANDSCVVSTGRARGWRRA